MSTEQLFQGPIQQWELSPEDRASAEDMMQHADELYRAYGEAYLNGCWIKEWGSTTDDPQAGMTAVGDMQTLSEVGFRNGVEPDSDQLSLMDCISLAYPGSGSTRIERVRDGMRQVLEARKPKEDVDALDLFGSFTENGYKVTAHIPKHLGQDRQWTIRVYKEGDEELYREEVIPMMHEPLFGVDVDDKAVLEKRVDAIMRELAGN